MQQQLSILQPTERKSITECTISETPASSSRSVVCVHTQSIVSKVKANSADDAEHGNKDIGLRTEEVICASK